MALSLLLNLTLHLTLCGHLLSLHVIYALPLYMDRLQMRMYHHLPWWVGHLFRDMCLTLLILLFNFVVLRRQQVLKLLNRLQLLYSLISKKEGKDNDSMQSSTTHDPGYQWESNKLTIRHLFPSRWPQGINKQRRTKKHKTEITWMIHKSTTLERSVNIFYWNILEPTADIHNSSSIQCWLKTSSLRNIRAIQKNCCKPFFTLSVRVIQEWDIIDIRRQSACLAINLVTVYSYVFLYKCKHL